MELSYSFFQINKGITEFETDEYRYWIILKGDGQLESEECTIFFTSHDALDIPFNKKFRIHCEQPVQIGCVILHNFQSNNVQFQMKNHTSTEMLRKIFYFAMDFQGLHDIEVPDMMRYVDRLMYEALLRTGMEEYKINPQLGIAIGELNRHIFDPDYDINELIKKSGYSQSYFRKIFLRETGVTPGAYVQKQRMEHAGYLLKQKPPLSIKAIAEQCCFSDVYYFSRVFRKWTGMSPSRYRESVGEVHGDPSGIE